MSKKRIVVTGLGVASCFGTDVTAFYQKLIEGCSGVRLFDNFDSEEYPVKIAAQVADFSAEGYIEKKQQRRLDPCISYGLVAGKKAIADAGIDSSKLDGSRCGVLLGSGMGGMNVYSNGVQTVMNKGYRKLTPFFIPYIITNMAGALLAIDYDFRGPNYSISTACATGSNCIVSAVDHIRRGDADLMVCGGTEAPITPIGLSGFVALKALSQRNDNPKEASRPWDLDRDGFVMGEGAGVLVLETLEHAQKRGATIYAEYLGGAVNCDAYHLTDPRPDGSGFKDCIELCLKDGGINKDRVDYINAHGTSTPVGDIAELKAVQWAFPDRPDLKMNSTKSMIGHTLGAAGGLEAIVAVKSIQTQTVHPTLNLKKPESELKIDLVPGEAKDCKIDVALSNSLGFGGHNASLAFSKFE
jgi:3-oxoacyl-[acyl-carrier-protein] synthase II